MVNSSDTSAGMWQREQEARIEPRPVVVMVAEAGEGGPAECGERNTSRQGSASRNHCSTSNGNFQSALEYHFKASATCVLLVFRSFFFFLKKCGPNEGNDLHKTQVILILHWWLA